MRTPAMYLHRSTCSALVSVAFLVSTLSSQAATTRPASSNLVLTVSADRPDAIYKQGEEVVFAIQLRDGRDPVEDAEVQWTLSKDGVPPLTTGTLRLEGGSATVRGRLTEPGFLQCRVVLRGTNHVASTSVAGVAVDPLDIKPSLAVPTDFDEFWATQKKQLAAVPVHARLTPVSSKSTNVECFDLQADSVGAPVSGYYARPVAAGPKSLPAILTVHGAGVRSAILGTALNWATNGMLALDINAHGLPNGKPEGYYTNLAATDLKDYRTRGSSSRETVYFRGMFLRLVRAIDFLTAQPEWDGRTLVVHGSSQGGAQAIVAAGLDPRVTFFAAGVPALCDHTGVVAGRVNGWPKFLANPPEPPDTNVVDAVRYYDAMNFASRVRCPGIVTVGFIDTTCPPTSVYAAYNAIAAPKRIFNDPPSTHTVSPRAGAAMREAILRHIENPRITLLRDTWGVPHVFAETDTGAMYGLGQVTAQERGFQMTYALRIMQGRLAEMIGDRPRGNGNETAVVHDRKMRTFGWARAAERTAANLDATTRELLTAYCAGVNDSFQAQQRAGTLHPLFRQLGAVPEPWTPADCLLSWWHVAQFFATDGTRDLLAWRNRADPRGGQAQPPQPGALWFDDAAAVVQRGDVSDEWWKRTEEFGSAHGFGAGGSSGDGPKFSHAWVVGGTRTTTGASVLVSDPQTPVRNPSLWMEFHVCGGTFNARGVGVPGSPGLLIGFNRRVAWGLTALGADQADLLRLETDPAHTNEYRWDGQWRKLDVRTELIRVKDGAGVPLTVRETHVGPVVSEFCFRQPGDPEVALKRVPICETNRDTHQAVFAMMRAKNATEFARALGDWRFPTANCVYGDADGHIGFATVGAIPVRPRTAPEANGNLALPGTGDADDWQGFVPQDLLPQVVDPKPGLLWSANHRPIGAFYRIPLGISTGSLGDTIRSWRLREVLAGTNRFSPDDVLQVHFDTVNPARRDLVRLGLHLRDTGQAGLSEAATNALQTLEQWLDAGASSNLDSPGAALATQISTFFRIMATPVARKYGGGESGLARFLKDSRARIQADPKAAFDAEEREFVDKVLADAWRATNGRGGNEARGRTGTARGTAAPLGWFDSLDGYGTLDPAQDLRPPGITVLDGETIHCQSAQSYTQFVPLHDPDSAQTICPIGHSDRPASRFRRSTMALWGEGKLHPAPLSRAAVEEIVLERTMLAR